MRDYILGIGVGLLFYSATSQKYIVSIAGAITVLAAALWRIGDKI